MFFHKWMFVLIVLINIGLIPENIAAQSSEYNVKAVLLWKITQYIEWPEEAAVEDTTKPITISILGRNPFGSILDDMYLTERRRIKKKNVIVNYISHINQLNKCHILFISASEKKDIENILSHLKGKPVLTVGDTENFGEDGIHINFYISNNKTKFELNEAAADDAGFTVDYRLRNIAKITGRRKGDRQ